MAFATKSNKPFSALLRATEQVIRTWLADTETSERPGNICGVTGPKGEPPEWAGKVFYAVHPVSLANQSKEADHMDREYSVGVTITLRADAVPHDRTGNALLMAESIGLLDRIDALAEKIHGNYTLLGLANDNYNVADQGFAVPLLFQGGDVVERGPDWWGADVGPDSSAIPVAAGLSSTLRFGGARVIREQDMA